MDIRSAVPRNLDSLLLPTVSQGELTFSDEHSIRLAHGDCLVITPVLEPRPSNSNLIEDEPPDPLVADDSTLLQLQAVQVVTQKTEGYRTFTFPFIGSSQIPWS